MGVAAVTIVLSLLVLLARRRAARAHQDDLQAPSADAPALLPERWGLMLVVSGLTRVYCAVLHSGAVQYGRVTVVYLLTCFLVVSDRPRKHVPWAVTLALLSRLGLDHIFRHLLRADLP